MGEVVKQRVLVIDDEPRLLMLMQRLLSAANYEVTAASTGSKGLHEATTGRYDLVILDLMLPDLPGETVLEHLLAARPDAKVLVLSSVSDIARRVGVLDNGAVDFLAKPFAGAELLARVRARIKPVLLPTNGSSRFLIGAGLELDVESCELHVDGKRIELSQREFVLLSHLLRRTPAVCTRQELLAKVWGMEFDPGSNVVDVYVRRLRTKLTTNRIETVRNVGYRLVAC
jgi:DNA-binding response OmpR family regulator